MRKDNKMTDTAPSHISSSLDNVSDAWRENSHLVTLKERPREQQETTMLLSNQGILGSISLEE